MEYVNLGASGLEVARIGLGTGPFGTEVEDDEAARMLDLYLAAGGNFLDTANTYGRQVGADRVGASEEWLGRTLGVRRHDVIVATKGYQLMDPVWKPNAIGLSRGYLRSNVEASLRRLRTDYIDLYQFHDYDFFTPMEESLRTVDDLIREGKVRHLGVSNWDAWHVVKAVATARHAGLPAPVSDQVWYNLADRSVEAAILPACRDQGLAIMAWGSSGRGVLARGMAAAHDTDDRLDWRDFMNRALVDGPRLRDTVGAVASIAVARDVSMDTVALRWLLQAGCDVALTGARTSAELEEALSTQGFALRRDELRQLFDMSAEPPRYPAAMYHGQEHRPPSVVDQAIDQAEP